MNLLFIDTETGGIPQGVSVLTVSSSYYKLDTPNLTLLDELNLNCKPNNNLYVIDPEALMVNKIDLVDHRINSLPYVSAEKKILEFLYKLYESNGRKKLNLCGQNIGFDLGHLFSSGLLKEESFYKYVDRRIIDVVTLSKTAQLLGLIPENQSLSLGKLAEYFRIDTKADQLHTAQYDNFIAAQVFAYLIELLKGTITI
jgi:hypothetical protein